MNEPPFSPTQAFVAVALAWFLSQSSKLVRGVFVHRRFSLRWLFETGGMPSSHSASVASLATSMGLYYGFRSMPFLMALIFAIITMFDAAGVRRSVGRQARILNSMLDELDSKGTVQEARLKELFGHTPIEVFAGAFLGAAVSFLICR